MAERSPGQAQIEIIATLPLLVAVAAVVLQLMAFGYSQSLADGSAEAGAVAVGGFKEDVESARQPLRVLIRLVAYVMHLPSSVLMNLLWTIPCVVTALPRCLAGKSVT